MTDAVMRSVRRLALPLIVLGFLAGIGVGLYLGWQVWPVVWYDTDPVDLRTEHKASYVLAIADSLAITQDTLQARRRLFELTDDKTKDQDVANLIDSVAREKERAGEMAASFRLRTLAAEAGLPQPSGEPPVPTKPTTSAPGNWAVRIVGVVGALTAVSIIVWWALKRRSSQRAPRLRVGEPIPEMPGDDALGAELPPWEAAEMEEDEPPELEEDWMLQQPSTPARRETIHSLEPAAMSPDEERPVESPRRPARTFAPDLTIADDSHEDGDAVEEIVLDGPASSELASDAPLAEPAPWEHPESDEEDILDLVMGQQESAQQAAPAETSRQRISERARVEETIMSVLEGLDDETPEVPQRPAPAGALGLFEVVYHHGDDDFDRSFSIESPKGDFMGECGVGISDVLPTDAAQKVDAFELWLFDKGDIRTISKVLASDYAHRHAPLRARLSAKGEMEAPQIEHQIELETLSLRVIATIRDFAYRPDDVAPDAVFERMQIDLLVERTGIA